MFVFLYWKKQIYRILIDISEPWGWVWRAVRVASEFRYRSPIPKVCFWGNWIKHQKQNKWADMLCPATVLLHSEEQGCPVQLRIGPCLAVPTLQQLPAPWCWTQNCASKNYWKTCSYADRTAPSLGHLSCLLRDITLAGSPRTRSALQYAEISAWLELQKRAWSLFGRR